MNELLKQKGKYSTDKIRGSLYGFAIGDALGATTEFMDENEIKRRYGQVTEIIGGGWLHLKPGEVTDDTQMMLCVLDALYECKSKALRDFELKVAGNFIKWLRTNPKDVGGQCRYAISAGLKGGPKAMKRVAKDDEALGNGSLMRALPCAIFSGNETNFIQSSLTHNNHVVNGAIFAYDAMLKGAFEERKFNIADELNQPTGHVLDTLNNASYWASKTDSFEEALIGAVNHGGDADTIAAITGGLVGAKYGFKSIPKRWVDKLDKNIKNKLDFYIEGMYK